MKSVAEGVELWVRAPIRAINAYHVPESGGLIKLDAMENPYTWPEELRQEWSTLLRETDVNRYPDPQAQDLKARLRYHLGIGAEQGLLLGNGSDEVIQMILLTLAQPGRVVLSVEPGFVMYRMIATFAGLSYVGVDLKAEDFALDLPRLLEAIERERPAVIFLAVPNNPTGNCFDLDAIRTIIAAAPGLVVVDEAYGPFTEVSFLPELGRYPNLLVMRTLSKLGLAGLRLGLLCGPPEWIAEIDKTRLPYNINILTQVSAALALAHEDLFQHQAETIRRDRELLYQALRTFPGLHVYPSQANFLLCRLPSGRGSEIHRQLIGQGVLVKNLHGAHPRLQDCLRVTVGRVDENQAFLHALADSL